MNPKRPVIVVHLFAEERTLLLDLLRSLTLEQWLSPTSCPGWTVKDIAAHILGDDLGNLSAGRDGFTYGWFSGSDWNELVAFINQSNEAWVDALRRLSPKVLIDLLSFSGPGVQENFRSRDPTIDGPTVSWAGTGPHPMWLHIAREYTERWLHQMQIREAVGAPGLYARHLFYPLLDTFVHTLPVAYASTSALTSTHIRVEISGEGGGSWSLLRIDDCWQLSEDVDSTPSAVVRLDQDTAWRLWTKGLDPEVARAKVRFEGDATLCEPVLHATAIIA